MSDIDAGLIGSVDIRPDTTIGGMRPNGSTVVLTSLEHNGETLLLTGLVERDHVRVLARDLRTVEPVRMSAWPFTGGYGDVLVSIVPMGMSESRKGCKVRLAVIRA